MSSGPIDIKTGVPYPKLQSYVAMEVPYLVRQAAEKAGMAHSTLWVRDRIARALAEELDDVDYDEVMAAMPPTWAQRPGAVVLSKPGV